MNKEIDPINRGKLFINEKRTEEKHPHWTGSINIDGVEYWISSWKYMSKDNRPYQSLSARKKEDQTRQISQPTRKTPLKDEDIPW